MDKMLVGSWAMRMHWNDSRLPHDIDFFSKNKIPHAETFWHPRLEEWPGEYIPTKNEIYTIKISHLFWKNRWNKHANDCIFMQQKGCELIPDFYNLLYPIWEERFGPKPANLNATADEFFGKNIERQYVHDSIHEAIMYYDEPLFNRIHKDGEEIAVDKGKFDVLEYSDQLKLVREELYVMALERQLIPGRMNSEAAYSWALKQMIISFSKGWFALFVALNLNTLRYPDKDYLAIFNANKERLQPC